MAGLPGAPTGVLGLRGHTTVKVSWTPPADNGGTAIVSYSVKVFQGGTFLQALTVPAPSTATLVTGLTNGTAYTFKVSATNATGQGPESVASLPVTPEAARATWSLSGTVSYGGSKTGRIFLIVRYPNSNGSGPLGGTVLDAPGAFTIRGLMESGTLELFAWRDTSGGEQPIGTVDPMAVVSLNATGADLGGQGITLVDPTPATPNAPAVFADTGDGLATINFVRPTDSAGFSTATHYTVEVVDVATDAGFSYFIHAGANPSIAAGHLTNGTTYVARARAHNPAGASPVAFSSPFTPSVGTGGFSVSGVVNGVPANATGPLYVYAFSPLGTQTIVTRVTATSPSTSFSVPHVPAGQWMLGATLDQGDDGELLPTEPQSSFQGAGALVTVTTADVTGRTIQLMSGPATANVLTADEPPSWGGRKLSLELLSGFRLPTQVVLLAGPQVRAPMDLGIDRGRSYAQLAFTKGVALLPNQSDPVVGDTYTFQVTSNDGGVDNVVGVVSGVVPAPTPLGPVGVADSGVPTFTWAAPAQPPAGSFYEVGVARENGDTVWRSPPLFGVTSVAYDFDSSASEHPLAGSNYRWYVSLTDALGNRATRMLTFSAPTQVTVIPDSVQLAPAQTQRFAAVVTGATDTTVSWSVTGGGSIDGLGLFTPAASGTFTVTATSNADGTTVGTATVTVGAGSPVHVDVTPGPLNASFGGSIGFTATVTNATDTDVTWTVAESNCGTIDGSGNFLAPSRAATCHVVATANADGTTRGVSEVVVSPPMTVVSGTVSYGGSAAGPIYLSLRAFTAAGEVVYGTSVDSAGAYTFNALLQPGSYTVEAFLDALGTTAYSQQADPYAQGTLFVSGASTPGAVNLTLTDPAAVTPGPPGQGMVMAGPGYVLVQYQPVMLGNVEQPSSYEVVASTSSNFTTLLDSKTSLPGARMRAAVLTVPDGGAAYAGARAVGRGGASAYTPLGQFFANTMTGANTIGGVVNVVGGATPTGPLYLWARGPGPTQLLRVDTPTYPQPFTLQVSQPGTWDVCALIDEGGDGVISAREPVLEGSAAKTVQVVGASGDAGVVLLPVAAERNALSLTHYRREGSEGYLLQYEVEGVRRLARKVSVVSALRHPTQLDFGVAPSPQGRPTRILGGMVDLFSAAPQVADVSGVEVVFTDGTLETLLLPLGPFSRALPTLVAPKDFTNATSPTFTWSGASPSATLVLRVREWNGFERWSIALPPGTTSQLYNSDGHAIVPALSPGTEYSWTLEATDANGNRGVVEQRFAVQ